MIYPDRLDSALARLAAALAQLEAAAETRAEADLMRVDLDVEFHTLQEDRARLAEDLDAALARGQALLRANAEVARRLDRAGATVQAVLSHLDPDPIDAIFAAPAEPSRASGRSD